MSENQTANLEHLGQLDDQIKRHIGQFAMTIRECRKRMACRGEGEERESDWCTVDKRSLWIISKPIVFSLTEISILADRWITCPNHPTEDFLVTTSEHLLPYECLSFVPSAQLIIGDMEVAKQFDSKDDFWAFGMFYKMAAMLGRPLEECPLLATSVGPYCAKLHEKLEGADAKIEREIFDPIRNGSKDLSDQIIISQAYLQIVDEFRQDLTIAVNLGFGNREFVESLCKKYKVGSSE